MKVVDILEKSLVFDKKNVEAEGFLMYTEEYVYIAPSFESFDKVHESIQIIEPDFMKIVESSNAPPYGGWLTLYPYEIVVEGILHCSDNLPFPAMLDSITTAYLIGEEGDIYQLTMAI